MIGVLVVTHSRLGEELIKTAEFIVGRMVQSRSLSLDPGQSVESLRSQIQDAIRSVDDGDGVIVLVDMLGGTPSNLSLSFLDPGQVEVGIIVMRPADHVAQVLSLYNRIPQIDGNAGLH